MKKIILLTTFAMGLVAAKADNAFFQASLTPDLAIETKNTQINGICLSIWGENPQQALALGFVNGSTGDSAGLSWGLINYADTYTGLDMGLVNWSKEKFAGIQLGAANITKECRGLQLGVVNYAENLHGIQLGFLNFAINNTWFDQLPDQLAKGMVFVNWSF